MAAARLAGCLLCPDLCQSIASAMLSILNPHFRKGFHYSGCGLQRQASKENLWKRKLTWWSWEMGRALHNQTTPTHLGCSPFLVTDHCDCHQQSRHHHHHLFAQVPKIKNPHFPPFFSLLFLCSSHTVLQIGRHSTCGLAYFDSPITQIIQMILWQFPLFS